MTTMEKAELGLMALAVTATAVFGQLLPSSIRVGHLLLVCSVMLLGQGLIRDLWLMYGAAKVSEDDEVEKISCICSESVIGVGGVAAGGLLLSWVTTSILMSRIGWTLLVLLLLVAGFLIKDVVVQVRPFQIRKARDHRQILVSWKQ